MKASRSHSLSWYASEMRTTHGFQSASLGGRLRCVCSVSCFSHSRSSRMRAASCSGVAMLPPCCSVCIVAPWPRPPPTSTVRREESA